MNKITIRVPQKKDDKWTLSWGKGGIRKRNSATVIYNAIERHLQARQNKEKMTIMVEYDKDATNESEPSLNSDYLLYCTVCFLEDYLNPELVEDKTKKYSHASNN